MGTDSGEAAAFYSLSERYSGGQAFEIDRNLFDKLSKAVTTITSAWDVEDLFQVFAKSFLRFEKDLLNVAFDYAYANIHDFNDADFFNSIRHGFNVNIITILTAYQSYDHQCDRIFKESINQSEARDFNIKIRSDVFDTHLSYRVCARLRDYAQHRALPLGGFSIGGKANLGRDGAGFAIKLDSGFNVHPWLDVSKLKESNQCKAKLREELATLGYDKIDMKWLIRSFAGAIYARHAKLRAFLKPQVIKAGEEIAEGYAFVRAVKGSEAKLLELHGNSEKRTLRNDLCANVLKDFEKYTSLCDAERSYVTSQIISKKATYTGPVDA